MRRGPLPQSGRGIEDAGCTDRYRSIMQTLEIGFPTYARTASFFIRAAANHPLEVVDLLAARCGASGRCPRLDRVC
jgi:hypothetical protein